MNPDTPTSQNNNTSTETQLAIQTTKSLSVGKVFLTIYGLMTLGFIAAFIIGSASGDGLTSLSLFVNGLYIVPAAYALVFVVHMVVLAMERQRNKSAGIQIAAPPSSGLGLVVKSVLIGLILFFVGIMTWFLIVFQTR
jgi:hypothetical protein